MADLINVRDPIKRAPELEAMGVDIICAHVGIDQQMIGKNSIDSPYLPFRSHPYTPCCCRRNRRASAGDAVQCGADIVIVGGWIIRSAEVTRNCKKNPC